MSSAVETNCPNCGMSPRDMRQQCKQRGILNVIITSCFRCGQILKPPIEMKAANEETSSPVLYGKLVEGVHDDNA